MNIRLIAFSRLVIILGLAAWLSIAIFNNLTDPGTNRLLLGHTLSMALVRTEEVLGAGLLWRAWPAHWSPFVLYAVVTVQLICATSLWRTVFSYAKALSFQDAQELQIARNRGILALSLFVLLWMLFICGGLWFGYWLKQGAIQAVHMTLILIGISALIFVQIQPHFEISVSPDNYPEAERSLSSTHERPLALPGDHS